MKHPNEIKTFFYKELLSIGLAEIKSEGKLTPYTRGYHDAIRLVSAECLGPPEWRSVSAKVDEVLEQEKTKQSLKG